MPKCTCCTPYDMPQKLPQETLNSVLSLLDSGNSHAEIMCITHVSSAYITRVTAKYHPHLKRSKGGHPQKLNPTNTCYVVCLVTNSNKVSTCQAAQALLNLTGEKLGPTTIHCALKEAGLHAVKKV